MLSIRVREDSFRDEFLEALTTIPFPSSINRMSVPSVSKFCLVVACGKVEVARKCSKATSNVRRKAQIAQRSENNADHQMV
jgi:hypothetical protein